MSLDPPALDRALAVATEAVQHAGAVALAYYTGRFDVTLKPIRRPSRRRIARPSR
jgi:hypothetical protein